MASTRERAWLAAHQKGSKALIQRLDKTHANNPEYQAFKKKHGLGDTSSVKQVSKSQVDAKKEKARQALAAKAYGATKGTRMGSAEGTGETLRDTIAPLTRDQHSAVKAAEREAKAAEKPVKQAKPKKEKAAAPAPEKKKPTALELIAAAAAKRKINQPPVSPKALRRIAAVGDMEHDHGGFEDLGDTQYGGRRSYNEEAELDEVAKWRTNPEAHDVDTDGSFLTKNSGDFDNLKARETYLSNAKTYINNKIKNAKNARKQTQSYAKSAIKLYPQKEEVEQVDEEMNNRITKIHVRGQNVVIHRYDSEAKGTYKKIFHHYSPAGAQKYARELQKRSGSKPKLVIENSYENAEMHKNKASKALETSDMEAYHKHMSSHHEELGKWHESKGRGDMAQKHFDKAEEHHEKGIEKVSKMKNEGILSKLLGKKPETKKPVAKKPATYQGLPKEWSQEKRGNEYDANKYMTGVKEEMKTNDEVPFEGPYRKKSAITTDKSGAKHTGTSKARDLARKALKKAMQKEGYMKQTVSDDDSGMNDYEHYMQTKGKKRQVEPPDWANPSDARLKPLPKAKKGVRVGSTNKFGHYTPGMKEEANSDATTAMSDTMKKRNISDKDKATLAKIHALMKAQKKPVKEQADKSGLSPEQIAKRKAMDAADFKKRREEMNAKRQAGTKPLSTTYKEEVEQIAELKKATLINYIRKGKA